MNEWCNECGVYVYRGSGNFINRVPDCNDEETRRAMGKAFPEGDFVCFDCDLKLRTMAVWDSAVNSRKSKQPDSTNRFIITATALEDQDYGIPDKNWFLPIAFSFGYVTTRAEIIVCAGASLPPGDCLKEGERIQIEGELREDDGNIFPVATAITRHDKDKKEEKEHEKEV